MDSSMNGNQDLINKLQVLHITETDDDKSILQSPILNEKLMDLLKKLPLTVNQVFQTLGPLNQVSSDSVIQMQDDGSLYLGELTNGIKHGHAFQVWLIEGNLLEGCWTDDILSGPVRLIYKNGDVFTSHFENGAANGFGVFHMKRKIVKGNFKQQIGIWYNNVLNGEGQELRFDGTRYLGQFQNGTKQGRGLLYMKDGTKYEGQFHKNKFNGQGQLTWPDQSYFIGQFQEGIIIGPGVYYSNNGQIFQGYFMEYPNPNKVIQSLFYTSPYGHQMVFEKIRVQ